MKNFAILTALILLTGCAGSPFALSQMNAEQLRDVPEAQLCRAYNHPLSHTQTIIAEVKRRHAECDPAIRYCKQQGFKKGTHDMLECVAAERRTEAEERAEFRAERRAQAQADAQQQNYATPMNDGIPVYNASQCIGSVVAGVCHGSIAPAAGLPQVCHGAMLNGVCTGPMF